MANWSLHKYYRGVCVPAIKDRLNLLKVCPFLLNNKQTHWIIKNLTKVKTTASLTNMEYLEFLEQVWCIGAHIGINIPDPNENPMNKLTELSQILECIYNTIKPYITTRIVEKLGLEVTLTITPDGINLIAHTFTDCHVDIQHYGVNGSTLITVMPYFNDRHVYCITENVLKYYNNTIKPMCCQENRIKSLDTRIDILQAEKQSILNGK